MSYSVLNDLAEAMKALDGKKDCCVALCGLFLLFYIVIPIPEVIQCYHLISNCP